MRTQLITLASIAGTAAYTSPSSAAEVVSFFVWSGNDEDSHQDGVGTSLAHDCGDRSSSLAQKIHFDTHAAPASGSMLVFSSGRFTPGPAFGVFLNDRVSYFDVYQFECSGDIGGAGQDQKIRPILLTEILAGLNSGPTFVSANLEFTNQTSVHSFALGGGHR